MLVPARVDTRWWHDAQPDCVTVLLKGRLKFRVPTKPKAAAAPFPSMLLIFGEETRRLGVITTWDWKEEEYPV